MTDVVGACPVVVVWLSGLSMERGVTPSMLTWAGSLSRWSLDDIQVSFEPDSEAKYLFPR